MSIKLELKKIATGTKAQIKKSLTNLKSVGKIGDFGIFKDGINVYNEQGEVIFEISY